MQTFGNALENKLQSLAKASKKQTEADRKCSREFEKWLSSADEEAVKRKRFRDPMSLM